MRIKITFWKRTERVNSVKSRVVWIVRIKTFAYNVTNIKIMFLKMGYAPNLITQTTVLHPRTTIWTLKTSY